MSNLSYEESKKKVFFGLKLLAAITVVEVIVSLFGKGFLGGGGIHKGGIIQWVVILLLIGFSIYKARFIIFEFMHLGYEVKSLAWAVLFPIGLLIWAMVPFFQEGNSWKNRRQNDGDSKKSPIHNTQKAPRQEGSLLKDTYIIDNRG